MKFDFPLGQWSGVAVYDDVISRDICSDLVEMVNKRQTMLEDLGLMAPGKTVGGVQPSIKHCADVHISEHSLGSEIYFMENGWHENDIHMSLVKCTNHYVNQFPGLAGLVEPIVDSGYQLQKYLAGHGKYDEHVDGGPFGVTKNRFLAVILYLNDVNQGGETTFTRHGLSVKPVAGRVLIFPCHWLYPHRGEVSFDADKYIITTFIECEKQQNTFSHHEHEHKHESADSRGIEYYAAEAMLFSSMGNIG